MHYGWLLVPLFAMAAPASAQDFACRNIISEIRCADGQCTVSPAGAFTPMELRRKGELITLCAYSGCWTGPLTHNVNRSGTLFLHAPVKRDGGGDKADLSVLYHRDSRTAQIRFGEFASAMDCGTVD